MILYNDYHRVIELKRNIRKAKLSKRFNQKSNWKEKSSAIQTETIQFGTPKK